MTVKEFEDLISDLEKKGEINENSEIFVLKEEDQVMSEPDFLLTSEKDLILKFSYRNEVLIDND